MCISPTDALMGVCACARVLISLHCNKRTNPSNFSARPKGQNQHQNPGTPFFHFSQATWSFQTRPKAHDQPKECATSLSRVLWAKPLKLLSPPEHRPCISSRTSLFLPGTRNTSSSKCLAVTETTLLLERNKDPEGGLFPSKRDAPERRLLHPLAHPRPSHATRTGSEPRSRVGGPPRVAFQTHWRTWYCERGGSTLPPLGPRRRTTRKALSSASHRKSSPPRPKTRFLVSGKCGGSGGHEGEVEAAGFSASAGLLLFRPSRSRKNATWLGSQLCHSSPSPAGPSAAAILNATALGSGSAARRGA